MASTTQLAAGHFNFTLEAGDTRRIRFHFKDEAGDPADVTDFQWKSQVRSSPDFNGGDAEILAELAVVDSLEAPATDVREIFLDSGTTTAISRTRGTKAYYSLRAYVGELVQTPIKGVITVAPNPTAVD